LAAISGRSPELLLVDILDPNAAVEEKYLQYAAVTSEGLIQSGRLLRETESSIVLEGPEQKQFEILRRDLEEFRSSGISLMPEGMEKELDNQKLADVLAFIAQIGPDPKEFPGLSPQLITQQSVRISLPASAAFLYGESIRYESTYGTLDTWASPTDRALWKVEITEPGTYQVELDYACDPLHANNRFRVAIADRQLEQPAKATPSWDEFATHALGQVTLHPGQARLIIQSAGPIHRGALMRLRSVNLIKTDQ
jgi:putative heme-binding domain-containing protein